MRVLVLSCLLAASAACVVACSIDEHANKGFGCLGCTASGGTCVDNFCIMPGGSAGKAGGAGVSAGSAGVSGGTADRTCSTAEEGMKRFCYTGPEGTSSMGRCKAGQQVCRGKLWGACNGEVVPGDEQCNGIDDDCDGKLDNDLTLGSCTVDGQLAATPCATGMLQCQAGTMFCKQVVLAAAESCNGDDDDCDGAADEGTDTQCYDGSTGCKPDGKGGFTCTGSCHAGFKACTNGSPATLCAGEIKPAGGEECGKTPAVDDNCNNAIDETCTCSGSTKQACYGGPKATYNHGECKAGTQTCNGSVFGACSGDTQPSKEVCDGKDNDCNDMVDDVPTRGDPCTVDASKGPCHSGVLDCVGSALGCVTPKSMPEKCDGLDNDCDDVVDNGFDLLTDEANCGTCGSACKTGETCCGGGCVKIDSDPNNCGACGTICGSALTCCSGKCSDLTSDAHNCATCGHVCLTLLNAIGSCSSSSCKL